MGMMNGIPTIKHGNGTNPGRWFSLEPRKNAMLVGG